MIFVLLLNGNCFAFEADILCVCLLNTLILLIQMSGDSERAAVFFDSTSKGRLSSALSSSLNDSFLLSMKPSLKLSSSSAKDSDPLPPVSPPLNCQKLLPMGTYYFLLIAFKVSSGS